MVVAGTILAMNAKILAPKLFGLVSSVKKTGSIKATTKEMVREWASDQFRAGVEEYASENAWYKLFRKSVTVKQYDAALKQHAVAAAQMELDTLVAAAESGSNEIKTLADIDAQAEAIREMAAIAGISVNDLSTRSGFLQSIADKLNPFGPLPVERLIRNSQMKLATRLVNDLVTEIQTEYAANHNLDNVKGKMAELEKFRSYADDKRSIHSKAAKEKTDLINYTLSGIYVDALSNEKDVSKAVSLIEKLADKGLEKTLGEVDKGLVRNATQKVKDECATTIADEFSKLQKGAAPNIKAIESALQNLSKIKNSLTGAERSEFKKAQEDISRLVRGRDLKGKYVNSADARVKQMTAAVAKFTAGPGLMVTAGVAIASAFNKGIENLKIGVGSAGKFSEKTIDGLGDMASSAGNYIDALTTRIKTASINAMEGAARKMQQQTASMTP